MFSLSRGILDIADPVMATLSWDPRDAGCQTEKTLLDPGNNPASLLAELPWGLADYEY